jgi:nucleoside-diphosphate-sugar epimerase
MLGCICLSTSEIVFEPTRPDDPERRRPNIDTVRRVLGWSPRVTPEEGLGRTIAWFERELERVSVA